MAFKFNLGDSVEISTSGEAGQIIGRAEHSEAANTYNVRYAAADGRAVEAWWSEGALEPDSSDGDGDHTDTDDSEL